MELLRDVRKAALHSLNVTPHTLTEVLKRTRDISDIVRSQAFESIAHVHIKALNQKQRTDILSQGIRDRLIC